MHEGAHWKFLLFATSVLHLAVVDFGGWSFLFLASALLIVAMLLGLIWRVVLKLCRSSPPVAFDVSTGVRLLTSRASEVAYFAYYAVSFVDLEFSAFVFLMSLVLGTISCLVRGAWLALVASVLLATYTQLYSMQQRRADAALSRGREFLFWAVSLLKPPSF